MELLFLEVQKRGAKTPTAHLLFCSPKPTIAAQAEPAQEAEGDTAWVTPEQCWVQLPQGGPGPSTVCQPQEGAAAPGQATQAHSREPLGHLISASHPEVGPGFSLLPPQPHI